MSASEPLVKISNLAIDGIADETRTRIINDVSLELNRGEVIGLIGESGAGKSTLGLAAMGFTRDGCEIVGGNIRFDGIDLVAATAETAGHASVATQTSRRLRGVAPRIRRFRAHEFFI